MKNFICEIRIGQLTIQFGSDSGNADKTRDDEEACDSSMIRPSETIRTAAGSRTRTREGWTN